MTGSSVAERQIHSKVEGFFGEIRVIIFRLQDLVLACFGKVFKSNYTVTQGQSIRVLLLRSFYSQVAEAISPPECPGRDIHDRSADVGTRLCRTSWRGQASKKFFGLDLGCWWYIADLHFEIFQLTIYSDTHHIILQLFAILYILHDAFMTYQFYFSCSQSARADVELRERVTRWG